MGAVTATGTGGLVAKPTGRASKSATVSVVLVVLAVDLRAGVGAKCAFVVGCPDDDPTETTSTGGPLLGCFGVGNVEGREGSPSVGGSWMIKASD